MVTMLQILAADNSQQSLPLFSAFAKDWPRQGDLLTWCHKMPPAVATLLILMGIIYLLFGYQIFKALVLLNAAIVGALLGISMGGEGDAAIIGAVIGGVGGAALAWPTMKYAVAIMGGICGVIMGAGLWHSLNLDPKLVWAGALVGLIGFGLFSFILFRGSIMMYTSLQGSFMIVFGILSLIYHDPDLVPKLTPHLSQPFLLPAAVFVPAVFGLIFQQHKTAHAGGNRGGGGGSGGSAKK